MNGAQISIAGVDKRFGSFHALKNVSLDIRPGEFFSLLGPSGCGKTTLLRIIAGFENADQGSLSLNGRDVLRLPPNQRQVNTVFQNYALFPHLTAFENIAFPLRIKKKSENEIKAEVHEHLRLVRLEDHAHKFPSQLSGGQKQRVAIARALINHPSALLLDEPLSALDAKLRQELLVELDRLHDAVGITFILVTHDQEEALSVSDRIAVMEKGEVLQVGTPFEIYESPATAFVADFIGDTNILEGKVAEVPGKRAKLDIPGIGTILADQDKPLAAGAKARVALRPEKILIRKEKPEGLSPDHNLLSGEIEEIIYAGFQSKFYVKTSSGNQIRVFKQHANYFEDASAIHHGDKVWLWWHAGDSYIVDVS